MGLRALIPSLLLAATAFASPAGSDPEFVSQRPVSSQGPAVEPGLEEWLQARKRTTSCASLSICPSSCSEGNMFLFPDIASLASCDQSMVLHMAVRSNVTDSQQSLSRSQWAIKACTANDNIQRKALISNHTTASLCSTPNHVLIEEHIEMSQPQPQPIDDHDRDRDHFKVQDLLSACHQLVNYIGSQEPSCAKNFLRLGYSRSAVVGLFAGAEIHQQDITITVLKTFLQYVGERSTSETIFVQLCGTNSRGTDYSIGIIASGAKNLSFVQKTVKDWADGRCVSAMDPDKSWMTVTVRVPIVKSMEPPSPAHWWPRSSRSRLTARAEADCKITTVNAGEGCWAVADRCGISQADLEKYNIRSHFCDSLIAGEEVCCSSGTLPQTIPRGNPDGTCKTIKAVSGDSCGSLAAKCGLGAQDFTKVNSQSNLCSTLQVGQPVCCTQGKMPDLTPKPNPDGSCFTYTTKTDDNCAAIAVSHGITVARIEEMNKKTWGWNGCDWIWVGTKMCLSTGSPPMPAPVSNAVCGPLVPGTKTPSSGTDLASLNPCPLNACCNIWGQCGITDEFCTISKSATGAPGTSAPGKNGCIASCGKDIIKGSSPPAKKIQVAYFESWNQNRECLTMYAGQIDTSKYTHVHFAFANITPDFEIDVGKVQEQFDIFKDMTGIQRIISLGGWDFSTAPGTFQILREAVKPGNRDIFQKNLIAFVNKYNLDGIDIDWEYPGASDIPGVPPGDSDAGMEYYQFLSDLKAAVGTSKSVSLAVPASYWYLRAFPIKEISQKVDYIVFMAYDLHGQWDYGNPWASSGCPTGNCLRSHVNDTETRDALSMITKAGVASNKIVVGVASYGRSFKMVEAGCTGPMCQFSGSSRESNAAKGRCTNTAGSISNAEIREILLTGKVNKQFKDAGSNILVYNDTQWVAWMDDDTRAERQAYYDSYNFAGTSDWAVDLQDFIDGTGGADYPDDYEPEIDPNSYVDCSDKHQTFEELQSAIDHVPSVCVEQYLINVQIAIMSASLEKYKTIVDKGYDEKFNIYQRYIAEQVPDQVDAFMASGKADKYFKCRETKPILCCNQCNFVSCDQTCNDRSKDCVPGVPGTFDMKCPTSLKDGELDLTQSLGGIPNATYTLVDPDGFWKDIGDEYGILQDWIVFGKKWLWTEQGCQFATHDIRQCNEDHTHYWYQYPMPGTVNVPNPKGLLGPSFRNFTDILSRIKTIKEIGRYDELPEWSDVLDASSLPASTVQAAVDSMEKVVRMADKIQKAEREEIIFAFISAMLFFIPAVGDAAGAELASLRSLLRLVGNAGDTGLQVYGMVEDPKNAFMAVFGFLAGAGLGRGGFKDAAEARRSLSDIEITNLGPVIKNNLDQIEKLRSSAHICHA